MVTSGSAALGSVDVRLRLPGQSGHMASCLEGSSEAHGHPAVSELHCGFSTGSGLVPRTNPERPRGHGCPQLCAKVGTGPSLSPLLSPAADSGDISLGKVCSRGPLGQAAWTPPAGVAVVQVSQGHVGATSAWLAELRLDGELWQSERFPFLKLAKSVLCIM